MVFPANPLVVGRVMFNSLHTVVHALGDINIIDRAFLCKL